MITGIFHQGSGLGNQLHRYVATRVLALDKGYEWGMTYTQDDSGKPTGFKGSDFMKLDLGKKYDGLATNHWNEKKVIENGVDIRGYDPEINFVKDNTIIDGEFQDERYWKHRIHEVNEWLKVEPIDIPEDVCVIGFRGGEFAVFPELFLTKDYWDNGIEIMKDINPNMKFEVHTDDPITAKSFFPEFSVINDIGINWRSIRYAQYSIIANSSFYILPRLLKHYELPHQIGRRGAITIAPRYWARRNTGVWALPQNYYSKFRYI